MTSFFGIGSAIGVCIALLGLLVIAFYQSKIVDELWKYIHIQDKMIDNLDERIKLLEKNIYERES